MYMDECRQQTTDPKLPWRETRPGETHFDLKDSFLWIFIFVTIASCFTSLFYAMCGAEAPPAKSAKNVSYYFLFIFLFWVRPSGKILVVYLKTTLLSTSILFFNCHIKWCIPFLCSFPKQENWIELSHFRHFYTTSISNRVETYPDPLRFSFASFRHRSETSNIHTGLYVNRLMRSPKMQFWSGLRLSTLVPARVDFKLARVCYPDRRRI